jgi:FkbM family methyltransferase
MLSMSRTNHFRHPIGRIESLGRRLYCATMQRLGITPIPVRAQGARFLVDMTDLIDRSVALCGIWEAEQLEDLAEVCQAQDADYFVDIGANTGVYAILFAIRRLAKQVIAFEPDPGNHARLVANVAANRLLDQVTILPYAVGSYPGEVTLNEAGPANRGESWVAHPDKPPEEARAVACHRVKQVRFDDEFSITGKRVVIKLDVEGSEFHALAGMTRTLKENACYLQVELYSDRIEDLKTLFANLGYRYLRTRYIDHYFTNMDGFRCE